MTRPKFSNTDGMRDDVGVADTISGTAQFDIDGLFALASAEPASVAPEHQQRVDQFVDFVGCLLGIVLSERQIGWLRTHTAEALAQPEGDEAALIDASIDAFRAVKDADHQTRHAWRQQNQPRFVEWIADGKDGLSPTLREWHTAAQQVLAKGRPPLTQEAAESWVELSTFASLIVQGKEPGTAAPQNLEGMIARLANEYQTLHPQQQLWIAFAPITLYEIRRSWPVMSAAERDALRGKLAAQFKLQPPQPASPPGAAVTFTPESALRPSRRASAWDRFRDDSSVESLQRQWAEAQERNDHQKAADLQRRIQIGLHQQAAAGAMLTNMMAMRHGILMKIADNLKA